MPLRRPGLKGVAVSDQDPEWATARATSTLPRLSLLVPVV